MTIRYANSAGSNTAPYDTFAKGATDPQTIIDLAVAGDTNYYGGTFTLSAPLDWDTNSGDLTNGFVHHVGVNATTGVEDGSKAVFDANNTANNCIYSRNLIYYHYLKNIVLQNAVQDGAFSDNYSYYWVWENCEFNNNGRGGIYGFPFQFSKFIGCKANGNQYGFFDVRSSNMTACIANDNQFYGFFCGSNVTGFGNIAHNNGTAQVRLDGHTYWIFGVADGWNGTSPSGIGLDIEDAVLIGVRITNNVVGISGKTTFNGAYMKCALFNNTSDTQNNVFDLGDNIALASDGYNGGQGGGITDDFNLVDSAEGKNIEIVMDGLNANYMDLGLQSECLPAGGGTKTKFGGFLGVKKGLF